MGDETSVSRYNENIVRRLDEYDQDSVGNFRKRTSNRVQQQVRATEFNCHIRPHIHLIAAAPLNSYYSQPHSHQSTPYYQQQQQQINCNTFGCVCSVVISPASNFQRAVHSKFFNPLQLIHIGIVWQQLDISRARWIIKLVFINIVIVRSTRVAFIQLSTAAKIATDITDIIYTRFV